MTKVFVLSSMADATRKVEIGSFEPSVEFCEIDSQQITRIVQDGKEVRDPESVAILEEGLIKITSIERVGIFEVYM
jgi:hypothetical protein